MKLSADDFACMIGMTRQTLWNKEKGTSPWTLPELVEIIHIMQRHGIADDLTIPMDGNLYRIIIQEI